MQGKLLKLNYSPNPSNTFSLSQVGESVCLFRKSEWYASQNLFILKPYDSELCKKHIFVTTAINKALIEYKNAYVYPTLNDVKNLVIKLPMSEGRINYRFMETLIAELEAKRVAELEAERVAELAAYLKVSGFDNCELSKQELNALGNLNNVKWKEFKVGNLFEKIKTNKLPYKAKDLPTEATGYYTLPCLTSSFKNQGLNYYAPKQGATILKSVITIPQNSDVYRAYYQSSDFTVLSDAYAIDWKYDDRKLTREQYLFMVMCINKVTDLPIYSYKNKLGGWNVVKDKFILLPQLDGEIDFAFMNLFITAIEKLSVENVVKFADEKIEATKEVVNL